MKKNIYLGINEKYCCLLYSLAPFDILKTNVNDLDSDDFIHDATNWGGRDKIERTLSIKKIKMIDERLVLPEELIFYGEDYDCGRREEWKFKVKEICKAIPQND